MRILKKMEISKLRCKDWSFKVICPLISSPYSPAIDRRRIVFPLPIIGVYLFFDNVTKINK